MAVLILRVIKGRARYGDGGWGGGGGVELAGMVGGGHFSFKILFVIMTIILIYMKNIFLKMKIIYITDITFSM